MSGEFVLEKTLNQSETTQENNKPSRAELLQRLRMAQFRGGGMNRMSKKVREEKLEEITGKLGQHQQMVMDSLKSNLTPDQVKQLNKKMKKNKKKGSSTTTSEPNDIDVPDITNATPENPITIPINIPKMSKVSESES